MVRVAVTGQGGAVTVRSLSSIPLTGKVDQNGTKLGQYSFAQGVEILDVSENRGAVISPARLAGLDLNGRKVRYYSLNPQGEIDTLILSDVTGDACQYGVITRFEEEGEGMSIFCTYRFDVSGTSYTVSGSTKFPVTAGAIQILGDPANPDRLYGLTSVKAEQIAGNQIIAGNRKYTISDNVVVYEYRNGQYFLSSLARAENGGDITGWYDKAESAGGRIRVIVVK